MPRLARSVFAKVPHHITQRGNRRDPVLITDEDRHAYLDWLSEYAGKNEVEVLAYCLIEGMGDWSAWLAQGDEPGELEILRRNADKGLPCGSQKFIGKLERLTGRVLQYRLRGRPRKDEDKG